jgi:hypothetical protein
MCSEPRTSPHTSGIVSTHPASQSEPEHLELPAEELLRRVRPLPDHDEIVIEDLSEEEGEAFPRGSPVVTAPGSRGAIVIDPDVFSADLVPTSRWAERSAPIITGRPAFISFQTAAELRYGASILTGPLADRAVEVVASVSHEWDWAVSDQRDAATSRRTIAVTPTATINPRSTAGGSRRP